MIDNVIHYMLDYFKLYLIGGYITVHVTRGFRRTNEPHGL